MSKSPTLLQEVEQFIYTHAPNALHKRPLFDLVKKWEDAYVQRIEELEGRAFDKMVNEGAPVQLECACGVCYECRNRRQSRPYDDDDIGNRYGND